jgi:hypothetical protein
VYTTLAAVTDKKNREGNPEKRMTRSHGLTKENLLLSQALEERKTKTGRQKSNVKLGHLKKECRGKKKDPPIPSRLATAAIADYGAVNNERSFYFTFGQMHDKEDNISHHERCCNITLASTRNLNPRYENRSTSGPKLNPTHYRNNIRYWSYWVDRG